MGLLIALILLLILVAVVAYIALVPFMDVRRSRALAKRWHREQRGRKPTILVQGEQNWHAANRPRGALSDFACGTVSATSTLSAMAGEWQLRDTTTSIDPTDPEVP